MGDISVTRDAAFLRQLDLEQLKTGYAKIIVLDNDEKPIRPIESRISAGNISINGSSAVRRAGSLTFVAEEGENNLTDIDNLLSMNKKVKILIGLKNTVDNIHDDIIWFNQGIFVITNISLSHSTGGVQISLQFKDKMCLLNGENGGGLPASITFHEYDQLIGLDDNDGRGYGDFPSSPNNYTVYLVNGNYYMWDSISGWVESSEDQVGSVISVPNRVFDIIQTLVCNYGNESISNIIINDVPLELKASVRYTGSNTLFYNTSTGIYTLDENVAAETAGNWLPFGYNEDCGYIYTDFTYPGTLISGIGENICSILEKIKNTLGNFEYFYDTEGHFIFQEKKNYLNTSYSPVQTLDRTTNLSRTGSLLDSDNFYVDFSNSSKSIYTFDEGSALITSYSNTPQYANIKNDFHVWGKNKDNFAIHYHLAIKEKPIEPFSTWRVVDITDSDGKPTGAIRLATAIDTVSYDYIPADWRAELYLQGRQKQALQQRPDIYEQELLDLFDTIYDMKEKKFKADLVNHPNDLQYWFDYIKPTKLFDMAIDNLGSKIYSYQKDKIYKLYNTDIPNVIMINANSAVPTQMHIIDYCESIGQPYSRVSENVYSNVSLGTVGYTAQETMRDLLYQYTDYNESISLTSIPIYYLDVNKRITVNDKSSGISGDYIVNSINLNLDVKSTMTISASRALERV